jgi:hypothetical protein
MNFAKEKSMSDVASERVEQAFPNGLMGKGLKR